MSGGKGRTVRDAAQRVLAYVNVEIDQFTRDVRFLAKTAITDSEAHEGACICCYGNAETHASVIEHCQFCESVADERPANPSLREDIEGLVAKWRTYAMNAKNAADPEEYLEYRDILSSCADELERTLGAGREASDGE